MNESKHRYERPVDADGDDSLAALVRRIRPGSRVLDLGVATGYLGRFLKEQRNCRVDGMELDPAMASAALPWFDRLLVGDLEREVLAHRFPRDSYDYVVCADVLEHLVDPGALLRQVPALLKGDGRLLVSLPNSAYAGLLLELHAGEFRYRPEGLLDRTHLRFFTRRSARRLLEEHGFAVEETEPVRLPFERSEFHEHFQALDPALVARLGGEPDADAYQYVFSARARAQEPGAQALLVDLVVPVYRGFESTRRCLESVLAFPQATPFELVVIDDASPDPRITEYLDALAGEGRIRLLRNPCNRGFTSCANRALALHGERDLVLLNSDTAVHGDWLDRLYRAAHGADDVGTVTPLTNNGTIAGYPLFCGESPMPDSAGLARLDRMLARVNPGATVEIPTAVGFCVLITRRCIDRVGCFDQASFPRGYGEENDYSLRAANRGLRNLLCTDLFVAHQGSVSFGEEKEALYELGATRLLHLHPDYYERVAAHTDADPARIARRRLDMARLAASDLPRVLLVTHAVGGGTERHVRELCDLLQDVAEPLVVRSCDGEEVMCLNWGRSGEEFMVWLRGEERMADLERLCRELGVGRLHFHHLIGFPREMMHLAGRLGVPYDFTLHDYYSICPQYNLTLPDGRYCGEPDSAGCAACLADRPAPWGMDIGTWRDGFHALLAGAQRVIGPSTDVIERIRRYFPDADYLHLPHAEVPTRKVLVFGTLTRAKGAAVLEHLARDARDRRLPLYFRVLGSESVRYREGEDRARDRSLPLSYAGPYGEQALAELIREEAADVIYFPAQWPETYSYTLSAALRTGLPILAPDIGAFTERLKGEAAATLIPFNASAAEVNRLLSTLAGAAGDLAAASDGYLARYLGGVSLPASPAAGGTVGHWFPVQGFYRQPRDFAAKVLPPDEIARILGIRLQARGEALDNRGLEAMWHRSEQVEGLEAQLHERERQIGDLHQQLSSRLAELHQARERGDAAHARLDRFHASRGFKACRILAWPVRLLRRGYRGLRRRLGDPRALRETLSILRTGGPIALRQERARAALRDNPAHPRDYDTWITLYDGTSVLELRLLARWVKEFAAPPLISVLMPTYNSDERFLRAAIESVRGQVYPHWELCIADDASSRSSVRRILREYARRDARIKVVERPVNGHIAAASNSALALAGGDYVALLDHDDLLAPHALFWVAKHIEQHPGVEIIYSDEDKIDAGGHRYDPYFKPGWNPDLFRSHNLICHLGVYRRRILEAVGGFREGFDGAQDYDLALRLVERIGEDQVHHIPRVLYHWRATPASTAAALAAKPYAQEAAIKALGEHLERQGQQGEVLANEEAPGMYRVRYALPETPPHVTLVILTRDRLELLRRCVDSILERTLYPDFDILVVDNGSEEAQTLDYLEAVQATGRVSVLRDDRPFNFSALNNRGVGAARGPLIGLLNNDLEVIDPHWLEEMVSQLLRPGVGAVGARLWYPDDTLQHGGVVLGIGGIAGHAHKHLPKGEPGYFGRAVLVQNFSAVTGACLVTRKESYERVGGLDEEQLAVAFNDVDFCLRLRTHGYRIVWTPHAQLYHRESASRGYEDTSEKQERFARETSVMQQRWGELLDADPAYNLNLTVSAENFSIAWPPRQ